MLAERLPVPGYDRRALDPAIVHIGVGGFHRSHQAMYLDRLLAESFDPRWSICGAGVLESDASLADVLARQDCLYTLVERDADGAGDARVIGSIAEYLLASEDREALVSRMASERTRIVSLTVTESGYSADNDTFGLIAEALERRRREGLPAFTLMSCDNLEGNGDRARDTLLDCVSDSGLREWVESECRFPSSMVDRITPATRDADREALRERLGIEDRWPVVCEPFAQWVLEDDFACGRPELERVGVQLVGDVRPYELMKLRLLNAGHQALAYPAALLGFERVDEAIADPTLRGFVASLMEFESSPTLPPVEGIDLADYRESLLERFANPATGDRVARLAADSSARLEQFVLPIARDRIDAGEEAERCAAILACWARYAEGRTEGGEAIEIDDADPDALRAAAEASRERPEAFLERAPLDRLPESERFTAAFARRLERIRSDGVRAALADLAGRE